MSRHRDYTVGWICALPAELSAARAMLDEEHDNLPQPSTDHNTYTLGRVGGHNIVIACLPLGGTGLVSAATVAVTMRHLFTGIRFGLMVGIGGGAPSPDCDLRLGDVVVSKPGKHDGGVVQYDFGADVPGEFRRTGTLNKPPKVLLSALAKLMAENDLRGSKIAQYMEGINKMKQPSNYRHPGPQYDHLFAADYVHVDNSALSSCDKCDRSRLVPRVDRGSPTDVEVFYGTIASADRVMRCGTRREALRRELGVMCFEMEAAGLMDNFPCVVIRGICDYADSHKDKRWQGYAAATAAAFAKELLSIMPTVEVKATPPVTEPQGCLVPDHDAIKIPRHVSYSTLVSGETDHYQEYWHDPYATREEGILISGIMRTYRELMHGVKDPSMDSARRLIVRMMMMAANIVGTGTSGRTILHCMAKNGIIDVIQMVIDAGHDIEARDSDQRTPLHHAVIGNHAETVKFLVEKCGANVRARDLNGLLPWHCAIAIDLDNGIDSADRISSKMQILQFLAARTALNNVCNERARSILQALNDNPTADIVLEILPG